MAIYRTSDSAFCKHAPLSESFHEKCQRVSHDTFRRRTAGQNRIQRFMFDGMNDRRIKLNQWHQHELTFHHVRMRYRQLIQYNYYIIIQQNIKINRPRSPPGCIRPPEVSSRFFSTFSTIPRDQGLLIVPSPHSGTGADHTSRRARFHIPTMIVRPSSALSSGMHQELSATENFDRRDSSPCLQTPGPLHTPLLNDLRLDRIHDTFDGRIMFPNPYHYTLDF